MRTLCINHAEVRFKMKVNKTLCNTLTADDKLRSQGNTQLNSAEGPDYKLLQAKAVKGSHCTATAAIQAETKKS